MIAELETIPSAEVIANGRTMARVLRREYLWYQAAHDMEQAQESAESAAVKAADYIEGAPPDEITWRNLAELGNLRPDAAQSVWEEIKEAALYAVRSGLHAAETVEVPEATPYDRAIFLAHRNEIAKNWNAQPGLETLLVNAIATAQVMKDQAIKTMIHRRENSAVMDRREIEAMGLDRQEQYIRWGTWIRPRVSEQDAIDESKRDVEMWDREIARNVRQLRDLRRFNVSVYNSPGGTVNVAEKQVNVATN